MEKRTIRTFVTATILVCLTGCGDGGGGAPAPTAMLVPLLAGAPDPGRNLALAVSGNGRVVVGTSDSSAGLQAFRWVRGSAPQALGLLPDYTQESDANATNADGTVVVGESMGADSSRAFIWTARKGIEPLGDLPASYIRSRATGVSADGSVVVGDVTPRSALGEGNPVAFV
ncbi:MAG TPA: hypothetical protein VL049_02075 [Candidatus Dormibacteraeota bacterium]|nr:hypothetical protein [Candidatus Dormibacteraeota bacterium]